MIVSVKRIILFLLTGISFSCTENSGTQKQEEDCKSNAADILSGDSVIFRALGLKDSVYINFLKKAKSNYITCLSETKNTAAAKSVCLKNLIRTLATGPHLSNESLTAAKVEKKIMDKEPAKRNKTNEDSEIRQKKNHVAAATKPKNGIYVPGNNELIAIQTKFKAVTLDKLKEGYAIYTGGPCIKCHGALNIYKRTEMEWKEIIEIMSEKAKISDTQKDAVYKYVLSIKAALLKKAT